MYNISFFILKRVINISENIILIGHRGANKEAPENTLKSFRKAIELCADYIEFDIHLSKDGKIVIIHDENTLRTTGYDGLIKEMNLSELKKLDCGEGEKIPTIQELINIAKNKIGLQIEIKATGLTEKLINILDSERLLESTIISSFNHEELQKIKKLEPSLKISTLVPINSKWPTEWNSKKELIDKTYENGYYGIHPHYKLVDKKFIEYVHKLGLIVIPWTVDSRRVLKHLVNEGVDGIITNDIQKAKDIINYQ
ncbi:MAG: hypothetical protein GF317_14560 [Candidatus Lokiarchaeota archaeon]|nr:hypothetical protein [Candidatus Lokiarchaeota archaeon]MBD3200829.1 hypothetical protein [Candidatus Lokiarchaeota archaeon]